MRIDGLGALQCVINALSLELRWKLVNVYLYFMNHKQNYEKIYKDRAPRPEEDGRNIEDMDVANNGLFLRIGDDVEVGVPTTENGRDNIEDKGQVYILVLLRMTFIL